MRPFVHNFHPSFCQGLAALACMRSLDPQVSCTLQDDPKSPEEDVNIGAVIIRIRMVYYTIIIIRSPKILH